MVSTLQQKYHLSRANFQLNPKVNSDDRKFFFGSTVNLDTIHNIENSYLAGEVPRFYMFGAYGTGKTHLLYHLKAHFDSTTEPVKVIPLMVQIEAQSKTRYQNLHRRLLDAIGIEMLVEKFGQFQAGIADYQELQRRTAVLFPNENVRNAMNFLRSTAINRTLAWKWLTGERLSAGEQQVLAVTTNQLETGELVELLVQFGELFLRAGVHLLFLVDEAETLKNVTEEDAQNSWGEAFRRLAGEDNHSIGWILAYYQTPSHNPPEFMMTGDILDRLGDRGVMRLDALPPVTLKLFMKDLLTNFVIRADAEAVISREHLDSAIGIYPFTRDGLEAFFEVGEENADRTLPRTIIRALTSCAIEALRQGKSVIEPQVVQEKAPQEFSPQER